MMKTTKPVLPILTMIALALLVQSCLRDKECSNKDTVIDYEIGEGYLQKIPYKGFDTLTFVRTTVGDTHTFVGAGWKQYWGLTSTSEDCPQKERYEKRTLVFASATFPKPIGVSIYRQNVNKSTYLDIGFEKTEFSLSGVGFLGRKTNMLTIQSYIYDNVDSFSNNNVNPFPTDYMCYYNITEGVIRMRLSSGEIWELLKQ